MTQRSWDLTPAEIREIERVHFPRRQRTSNFVDNLVVATMISIGGLVAGNEAANIYWTNNPEPVPVEDAQPVVRATNQYQLCAFPYERQKGHLQLSATPSICWNTDEAQF